MYFKSFGNMFFIIAFLIISIAGMSCQRENSESKNIQGGQTGDTINSLKTSQEVQVDEYLNDSIELLNYELNHNSSDSLEINSKVYHFEYKNDTIIQKLEFTYVELLEIKFKYTSQRLEDSCISFIEGNAVCEFEFPSPGIETDVDENRMAYPSREYTSESKDNTCIISIRIAISRDKVQIHTLDCKGEFSERCPIKTIGILRPYNISDG